MHNEHENCHTVRFLSELNKLRVSIAQLLATAQPYASEATGNRANQRMNYSFDRKHRRAELLREIQRGKPPLLAINIPQSVSNDINTELITNSRSKNTYKQQHTRDSPLEAINRSFPVCSVNPIRENTDRDEFWEIFRWLLYGIALHGWKSS